MKYALLLFVFPLFLQANDELQQYRQLRWQTKQLIKHIQNPDSNKFKYHFEILRGNLQEPQSHNLTRLLQKDPADLMQDFKQLVGFNTLSTPPIDIERVKEKAHQELKERIFAKNVQLINRQEKSISGTKITSGFSYLLATCGFVGLGLLSKAGTLDMDDCKYLEPLIFEGCFGIKASITIPLKANLKTTCTLFGLGSLTAYYGLKDLYHGLFFSAINKHNLDEIRAMEEILMKVTKNHKN